METSVAVLDSTYFQYIALEKSFLIELGHLFNNIICSIL